MERFVIGAALFTAVVIAAGGYLGHAVSDGDGFRFEIGEDDARGGAVKGTGAPSAVAARTFAGTKVEVRNAVAILKVIPEDRADVSVEIANPGTLATPTVRLDGADVIVDGGIPSRRIRGCHREGGFSPEVSGIGVVDATRLPVITVRAPRLLDLEVSGAVQTDVTAAAASAELALVGCGPTKVGDVAGALEIDASGSGDITTGTALSASVSQAGSGNTTLGAINGPLSVELAGSGGVTAASAAGALEVQLAGSGDVTVTGGAAGDADVEIAGSGDVVIGGSVGALDVSIAGSGGVDVRGDARSIDAEILGSGDVVVGSVAEGVQKSVMGSGSVTVRQ